MLGIESLSSRDLLASNVLATALPTPDPAAGRHQVDCEGFVYLTGQMLNQAQFNPKELHISQQVPWKTTAIDAAFSAST